MTVRTVIRYLLVVLIVVIFGGLAGWYLFLRSQTGATTSLNNARGFGTQAPVASLPGQTGISDTGTSGGSSSGVPAKLPPQLWHVTTAPVAGSGFATTTDGSRLRYMDRATGYIFEANPLTGAITRLSNMLMPKTYDADFASLNRVLARSTDSTGIVTTYAGILTVATSSSLSGVPLPKGITAVAPDPKTNQVFYLRPQGSGVAGVISGWDGSKQKQIFSSAIPGWRTWWLADGRIILAQKASDDLTGYAYTLQGSILTPLVTALPGLTVLPRTGSSALLYGTSSGGSLTLYVQASATTSPTRLAIATTADKCVWAPGKAIIAYCGVPQTAPSNGFLDAWYRGEIHTTDAIWRIDAGAGQAQLIFTPTSDTRLDIMNPSMDDSGAYLTFMNGLDGSAWLLRLNK